MGALALMFLLPGPARAEFPYQPGADPSDYTQYRLAPGDPRPNDLSGKLVWMYAATAEADSPFLLDRRELNGIRGAHLVDVNETAGQAWHTSTGRPDVAIGVTDSGIEWDNDGAMADLSRKTRISRGETPVPQVDAGPALEPGADCATFLGAGRDRNGDGVFNIVDYACDNRVRDAYDDPRNVNPDVFEPQDILIAFSDGNDDDSNGYVDDMVGWDFLDDDNDPYDDVSYGHGTGEARDSNAEAGNGGELATCPNCMVVHLRVGTSFIADVNRFAEAVVYSADNDVYVVQDALGTLNKSKFALDAIKYAYDHGTTVIASAADEAAQHHNQPSSMPYSIVVNSVTHFDDADAAPGPSPVSYLQFNGCTNFSSRITLAIPSVSCSSDATGRAAGMAGLVYSTALNAIAAGRMTAHPTCRRVGGAPCPISANEVRQIMASGLIGGTDLSDQVSDDVDFAQDPLTGASTDMSCLPVPAPTCTDPFQSAPPSRIGQGGASYPAREGHDQFYGYGRVNMKRSLDAVLPPGANTPARIPPEVEVTSPDWFDMVDPGQASLTVTGTVDNRGGEYSCEVLVAPGAYAGEDDFTPIPGGACNGQPRTGALDGALASIDMETLKGLFPGNAGDFNGREPGVDAPAEYNRRPNEEAYGFVVKVRATSNTAGVPLVGQDRRQAYLHRDPALLEGFPRQLAGDAESSPVLADVDGDNSNELVVANSDGVIHVFERDGGEAAGWPRTTHAVRPNHVGAPGLGPGGVEPNHEAVLATPAVADLDRDGTLEIVVADLDRRVRVFEHDGTLRHELTTDPRYAGIPGEPFVNLRHGPRNRVQPGFIGSPVLADIAGDSRLEIIAASMDRHVYAWKADGAPVDGWPVLVVDRTKVESIDPASHRVTFKPDVGANFDQGAIVDTPAVGDLTGDDRPEIVVGTNESYAEPINADALDTAAYAPLGELLDQANGRLFAIKPEGEPGGPSLTSAPWLDGWPFKVGVLAAGILPLVGEGITGSPVIASVPCNGSAAAPRVGTIPAAGLPYIVNANGVSCYGRPDGRDRALQTRGPGSDPAFLAAFGHPAFGTLGGQTTFLAPAAGAIRAGDVALPEYQGGRDYLAAWNTQTGQLAPGWPAQVNDLQFLTGPSLADLGGAPGQEVVGGTAHNDLYGLSSAGTPIDTSWPKLTGGWLVMNPVVGTWGEGANKVLVTGTRNGRLLAYETPAAACAPADWPQFHHDPANSGDARRDAVPPGFPVAIAADAQQVTFEAPGDDLLCGTAARYEASIDGGPWTAVEGAPKAAGSEEALTLAGTRIAIRAVDEQGNVGRPAQVERTPGGGATPTPTATATATATSTASPTPTVTRTPTATPTPPIVCSALPAVRVVRARVTRRRAKIRGTAGPGCAHIDRVLVGVSRRIDGACRPVRTNGRLGSTRACRKARYFRARGVARWRLKRKVRIPPGRYAVRVRAVSGGVRGRVTRVRVRVR